MSKIPSLEERRLAISNHNIELREKFELEKPTWANSELRDALTRMRTDCQYDFSMMLIMQDYLLQQATELYYNNPEEVAITDDEFDEAKRSLKEAYAHAPELKPSVSIVDMVGAPVVSGGLFDKYEHKYPMMSLGNLFNREDLEKWVAGLVKALGHMPELIVEYKYDGLAAELVYTDCSLTLGGTRGDGLVGDDITENLMTITSIPKSIAEIFAGNTIVVYGEVMCTISGFKLYNASTNKPLKNPRNGAAGSVRLSDSTEVAKRPLTFVPYGAHYDGEHEVSHGNTIQLLADCGFVVDYPLYIGKDTEDLALAIEGAYITRHNVDFEYDGVVIKVNDREDSIALGYNINPTKTMVNTTPLWATAYKFKTEKCQSKLIGVDFQVGRHGTITPVAKIEPVDVGGVTVSSVTLHNRDELAKGSYSVGDTLEIHRAGEVVPQILGIVAKSANEAITYPVNCPCCSSKLKIDGASTYCDNFYCTAQLLRRLEHFVSRDAFDIIGMAGGAITQIYEAGLLLSPEDIFKLTKEDLVKLDRWGERKADNLLKAITKSKTIRMDKLIYSLGCASAGRRISKTVAATINGIEELADLTSEELQELPKIGAVIAKDIADFFSEEDVWTLIGTIQRAGVVVVPFVPEQESVDGEFKGMKFCITGKFVDYTRNQIRDIIVGKGGVVVDSVSKTTNYLICGSDAGSKLTKAEANGFTTIITELDLKEFLK